MTQPRRAFRFSLETKVMGTVLVVLIALPALTLWIVSQRMQRQMESDARLALEGAQASFVRSLKVRTDALTARFRTGINDSRFLRILRLADSATMESYLKEVLEEYDDETEVAFFVTPTGEIQGARRRNIAVTPAALEAVARGLVIAALQGEEQTGSVAVNGGVYHVVAIPVAPAGRLEGALVFGIHITEASIQLIRPPESEIVVLAGERIAASTLASARDNAALLRRLVESAEREETARVAPKVVNIGDERYLPVAGRLNAGGPPAAAVRYLLLSSSERRLRNFAETRLALLGLSGVGILVCGGIVWFFVRRITRPLVDLRATAEAVGRGEFSRRIERFSNDEFGDLAQAFNQMTASLQTSRAELEQAIQQVRTTQDQLIQSEKLSAVGQFVAGVAHELNNPLTAVVGFAELLQDMDIDARTRGYLERIGKSAHRCHKIVHSLLSFARQHEPERKLVALHTIIDEVLEIMAYDLRTSNITVVREFAPQVPPIMADGHQLQQVFVNILSNARQAIEPVQREGRIVVRTRVTEQHLQVEFQDNGPGIRAENLARIFDPFFTTKPVGKGTGLGLSLCYGIIREHGGTIIARSELGQGATFLIELPVAELPEGVSAIRRGNTPIPFARAPRAEVGRSILVIDDEQWILDLASELLRNEGHRVETAAGGQQALEILGARKFDVIISDWKMPGLNGMRLFEHLQSFDPPAAQRMLFMTGDVVNDAFEEFLRRHGLTCLSKPFSTVEFRAAVQKVGRAAVP